MQGSFLTLLTYPGTLPRAELTMAFSQNCIIVGHSVVAVSGISFAKYSPLGYILSSLG